MSSLGSYKFDFKGSISASKSLMNRAYACQIFFPELRIKGSSACQDVLHMKKAVESLTAQKSINNIINSVQDNMISTKIEYNKPIEIDCGEAGTVLRFLSVCLSRLKGEFHLTGTSRLFQRPHQDIEKLLSQLGVYVRNEENQMIIQSSGWKLEDKVLIVSRDKSSQFASGFLLGCWNLPKSVQFQLEPFSENDSYLNMTIQFLKKLGMTIEQKENLFTIPANQKIKVSEIEIEPDYSSVFSIAALAALHGHAEILNVGQESLQPDFQFIHILKKMNIPIEINSGKLIAEKASKIKPIEVSLEETPDLFPVLGLICAFAEGKSTLKGAPRLAFKESNRIEKTSDLLQLMGVQNEKMSDGLIIYGQGFSLSSKKFNFNPDQDHRMAMAAGILKRMGWDIEIQTPEVVQKSFPEFWDVINLKGIV